MKTLLKDLYDYFYTPPEFSEQKQEVEECHQALIKALEKPERRLVLRIMDAQSLMAEERSICMDVCECKKHPGGGSLYRGADQPPV